MCSLFCHQEIYGETYLFLLQAHLTSLHFADTVYKLKLKILPPAKRLWLAEDTDDGKYFL